MKRSSIQRALNEAAWLTSEYPIRLFGDPSLVTACQPVTHEEIQSGEAREWAKQMSDFLTAFRKHTQTGRGLAANQLGIPKQILLVLLDSQPSIYLNPHVMETTGEGVYPESCVSLASLVSGMVKRPWTAKIEYTDLTGNRKVTEPDPLHTRIMLHEIDHLAGQLCSDLYERQTIRINDGNPNTIVKAKLIRIR